LREWALEEIDLWVAAVAKANAVAAVKQVIPANYVAVLI
jgi:hypothetical protein